MDRIQHLVPSLDGDDDLFGSLVQMKSFGLAFVSARKRWMAAFFSTDRKTLRLGLGLASFAKRPSTALSQEAEVGVKWKMRHG